jgi:hypothetical protein
MLQLSFCKDGSIIAHNPKSNQIFNLQEEKLISKISIQTANFTVKKWFIRERNSPFMRIRSHQQPIKKFNDLKNFTANKLFWI